MPSPKKAPAPKPGPVDPAETHNKRILAERQRKIDEAQAAKPAPDIQTWNGHIFSWQQIGCRWRIVTDAPALVARQFLAACTG